MVKTHEIDLNTEDFSRLTMSSFLIIEKGTLAYQDYILFRELVENSESKEGDEKYTGQYRMTQVTSITEDDGLKDGFVMISVLMF